MDKPSYLIRRKRSSDLDWNDVRPLDIAVFFDGGSDHRPRTQARVLYDDDQLYIRFDVADQYVRVVAQNPQAPVSKDSCVEFFVQPESCSGYFNFEINAGGCLLLYYTPISPEGRALMSERLPVPVELVQRMNIRHSLPKRIDPEIGEPCEWFVEADIPFALFEHYTESQEPLPRKAWRANFYKCGDETSHPHWGMWSPIPDGRSFHRPDCFANLVFCAE